MVKMALFAVMYFWHVVNLEKKNIKILASFYVFGDNKLIGRQQTLSQLSLVHASDKKLILLVFGFFFLINIVSSGGHLDGSGGMA